MVENIAFGAFAVVAVAALAKSPIVRTIVAHTLRHPRKTTIIRIGAGGEVLAAADVDPRAVHDEELAALS